MIKKLLFSFVVVFVVALIVGSSVYKTFKSHEAIRSDQEQHQQASQVKFTIVEGYTVSDISKKFTEHGFISDPNQFLQAEQKISAAEYPFLASKPLGADLEGFLFPDTYFILSSSTPENASNALIQKALNNFGAKFTPAMEEAATAKKLSLYQVITLASIVEKETGRNTITDEQKEALDTERKIIAGIFYNRLKIGMALQSDATVNYITKKNTPSASLKDIETTSPYNTYIHSGLPPGPIANPSLSSIMAVLYPQETNYLYFLHKQPSGEPVYSVTYDEHVANKHKFLP